jgi:hypothetical protein
MYKYYFLIIILILIYLFFNEKIDLFNFINKKNKDILIIGSFDYHYECIGFLCEILNDYNITLFFKTDNFKYIEYFKQIYNINHIIDEKDIIYNNYDYIIKVSSNDPIIDTSNKKIVDLYKNKLISIAHTSEFTDLLNNYIIICPYIVLNNRNNEYILPIYNGLRYYNYKNNILYLGYFIEEFIDDDLINFNNNIKDKYQLIVCSYTNNPYLEKYNILNLHHLPMPELMKYIKNTKYILTRKNLIKDRLSGSIPFAISHSIPLIIKKSIALDYSIEDISLTFNDNYSEIIPYLLNDDDNLYYNIINKLEKFKYQKIKDNRIRIKKLLNNIQN